MNLRLLSAALCAIVVTCGWIVTPVRAAEQPQQTNRICLSVAQANAILAALPKATIVAMASENKSFEVSPRGSTLVIGTEKSTIVAASRIAYPGPLTCSEVPKSDQLDTLTAIKAAYLLAYGDAISRRSLPPWPGDPANLSAPEASVILAAYGSYYLVMFADQVLRRNSAGRIELGCGGVEYYRVRLRDEEVLPFNGCVESGGIPGLPRLSQLSP